MRDYLWGFVAGMCGVAGVVFFMAAYSKIGYFAQNLQDNWVFLSLGFIGGLLIWLIHIKEYFTEVDIHSQGKWPANVLSNLYDNPFYCQIAGLLATGNRKLVHSIGKNDKTQTVLTEDEFCRLLTIARAKLKEKGLAYIG